MAEDASQSVKPTADHIRDIKVEIDLTRARMGRTLREIDGIVAGRARTQLQRLHGSATMVAATAAGAIAVLFVVWRVRRRHQGGKVR